VDKKKEKIVKQKIKCLMDDFIIRLDKINFCEEIKAGETFEITKTNKANPDDYINIEIGKGMFE